MTADTTAQHSEWHPIATAPKEWVHELSIRLPGERRGMLRSGRVIVVRNESEEEIVQWAQQIGFAAGHEPHWFIFDLMPLDWTPTEWRELTAEESAALDAGSLVSRFASAPQD